MSRTCMLTTVDNPYNPFTQFKHWYQYDVDKGYYSCSWLARLCHDSSEMTDNELRKDIEDAIDTIVRLDFTHIYKKVYESDYKTA